MNFLVEHAAAFFGGYVFPAIVAIGASGIALALVGVGIVAIRAALHS